MFPIRDHNPSGRRPSVVQGLIAANVLVFLLTHLGSRDWELARLYAQWGLVPARGISGNGVWALFTHMFLHGGWLHLIGNMLFLWIFGDNLEDELGHRRFLGFYILSGLAAAGVQALSDPMSPVPMVGASGAIAGVLGGYLLMYPRARVDVVLIFLLFYRVVTLPAWIVLGVWFGAQLFFALSLGNSGSVAYFAHGGGFLAGLALVLPLWLARGGPDFWRQSDGAPPHPRAEYALSASHIPRVGRRR